MLDKTTNPYCCLPFYLVATGKAERNSFTLKLPSRLGSSEYERLFRRHIHRSVRYLFAQMALHPRNWCMEVRVLARPLFGVMQWMHEQPTP